MNTGGPGAYPTHGGANTYQVNCLAFKLISISFKISISFEIHVTLWKTTPENSFFQNHYFEPMDWREGGDRWEHRVSTGAQ